MASRHIHFTTSPPQAILFYPTSLVAPRRQRDIVEDPDPRPRPRPWTERTSGVQLEPEDTRGGESEDWSSASEDEDEDGREGTELGAPMTQDPNRVVIRAAQADGTTTATGEDPSRTLLVPTTTTQSRHRHHDSRRRSQRSRHGITRTSVLTCYPTRDSPPPPPPPPRSPSPSSSPDPGDDLYVSPPRAASRGGMSSRLESESGDDSGGLWMRDDLMQAQRLVERGQNRGQGQDQGVGVGGRGLELDLELTMNPEEFRTRGPQETEIGGGRRGGGGGASGPPPATTRRMRREPQIYAIKKVEDYYSSNRNQPPKRRSLIDYSDLVRSPPKIEDGGEGDGKEKEKRGDEYGIKTNDESTELQITLPLRPPAPALKLPKTKHKSRRHRDLKNTAMTQRLGNAATSAELDTVSSSKERKDRETRLEELIGKRGCGGRAGMPFFFDTEEEDGDFAS
ncbi:MAG: hypothetical protein M1827_002927 [Pycnora praestabilis]|nr:MAG: hypothetical protein M1827_002927 [Pycnora praestabilis]